MPKGQQRVLLGALLVHAGNPVSAGPLAEVVWGGSPPSGAAVTLQPHVLRRRQVLGPRLVTGYPGYLPQAGEGEVGALRVRCLRRDGGAARREGAWARDEVPGLEERRLQAEEGRIDAALHLGRADDLVAGLQALAARQPLRERFHAQLMLALHRCGRQAGAVSAYQHAWHVLAGQLATEPRPEPKEIHRQLLSADLSVAAQEPASRAREAGSPPTPRDLPPGVRHFTGRSQKLMALRDYDPAEALAGFLRTRPERTWSSRPAQTYAARMTCCVCTPGSRP